MKIYKKLFRRCMCFFFAIVFGLLTCLQGFCSSPVNIDMSGFTVSALKLVNVYSASSYSASCTPNVTSTMLWIPCSYNNNYFTGVVATAHSTKKLLIPIPNYLYTFNFEIFSSTLDSTKLCTRVGVTFPGFDSPNCVLTDYYTDSSGYRIFKGSVTLNGQQIINYLTGDFVFSFDFSQTIKYTSVQFRLLTVQEISPNEDVIEQFGSNYSQPNTSNFDNYNKAESSLYGGVESAIGGVNSQWNNINGDLLQYQGSFLAFNTFFNKLTDIPFIKIVLIISVAIGIFALLLGAVSTIVKHRGD